MKRKLHRGCRYYGGQRRRVKLRKIRLYWARRKLAEAIMLEESLAEKETFRNNLIDDWPERQEEALEINPFLTSEEEAHLLIEVSKIIGPKTRKALEEIAERNNKKHYPLIGKLIKKITNVFVTSNID